MQIKDILLTLTSYPKPTQVGVIDYAVNLAASLSAHVTAVSCEAHVQVPSSILSGLAGVPALIATEGKKSLRNAEVLFATFEAAAYKAGVLHSKVLDKAFTYQVPDHFAAHARLHDLTIVPVLAADNRWHSESIIFGAGRPVVVVPDDSTNQLPTSLDRIVIAWDMSRAAARAISDALPLLEKAKAVRIVTVTNEKPLEDLRIGDLAANLMRHGIDVVCDAIDAENRPIAEALTKYALAQEAHLLVMGAYGHSRLQEFVLGGATNGLLSKPPLPILLSH